MNGEIQTNRKKDEEEKTYKNEYNANTTTKAETANDTN